MSELNIPESWAETTLGEIGTTMIGLTYSPKDISEKGIPVLRSGNIQKGKIDLYDLVRVKKEIRPQLMIKEGDILICARNGSRSLVGKAAQVKSMPEPMTFGAFMAIYRSDFNNYVEVFLNSLLFRKQLDGVGTATINQITQNNLKQFSIPLPPIEEQLRILEKLKLCLGKINSTETNLNKAEKLLEKYRESLLAKAFRGELVPQDPNDEPASVLLEKIRKERAQTQKGKKAEQEFAPIADDEKPFDLPAGWEWVRLSEIIDVRDGTHDSPKLLKTGIPLITSKNLKNGKIDYEKISYISKEDHEQIKKRSEVCVGDLLMAMIGTLGNPVIVKDEIEFSIKNIALFKCNSIFQDLSFLKMYIESPLFLDVVRNYSQGTTQKFLGLSVLRNIVFPLPPLHELFRIIQRYNILLNSFNFAQSNLKQKSALVIRLRESILKKAFEGRLVEQIPSEGTGHELLEKILTEKNIKTEKEAKVSKVSKKTSTKSKGNKNGKK